MAIELSWDNDAQTVLRCEFPRKWSWDEMYEVMNKVKAITDSAQHEIAAILDVREGVSLPGGLFAPSTLEHAKKMLKMGEGGSGPVVVVGAGSTIKTIYKAVKSLDASAVSDVSFADTLDQARAMLAGRNHVYEGETSPPNPLSTQWRGGNEA